MLFLVFLGLPGAGKGTQCQLLKQSNPNVYFLSPGEILRARLNDPLYNTQSLYKKIAELISEGILLSDDIIMELVEKELEPILQNPNAIIIFDGIPRTMGQAEALNKLVNKLGGKISAALDLKIKKRKAIKRLSHRVICTGCKKIYSLSPSKSLIATKNTVCKNCNSPLMRRKDDNMLVVRKRLKSEHKMIFNICDFYRNSLIEINAESKPSIIKQKIEKIILSLKNSSSH